MYRKMYGSFNAVTPQLKLSQWPDKT